MTRGTQQEVYLVLCKAYAAAIKEGVDAVEVEVGWLEEALSYLDGSDNSRRLIGKPLDDCSNAEIAEILYKDTENV